MEVSNMAAFDECICVYCRKKINGLNNYIEHLKACQPFESLDTKLIPRLPFLRTPSRESLQSDFMLESSTESRCSSPDSYMQRIYDDIYRYEKEVIDSNSVASEMGESKNDEQNGDKDSVRCPDMSCQTVLCSQSHRNDRNDLEGLEEKLRELMGLDSKISGKTSVDGVTDKSEENVLNKSQVSFASSEKISLNPEEMNGGKCSGRALGKKCAAALLGSDSLYKMLGNKCECGLGCLENVFSKPRLAMDNRCLMENVPSAGIDTGSIDQIPEPMQNIPVLAEYEKIEQKNSCLSSGFTNHCDSGVKIYKVWGDTAELLAASLKECLLEIFYEFTLADKNKVLGEVNRLCCYYTSSSGEIQIKIVQALNKMNLLIKKIENEDDSVKLGEMAEERAVVEKESGSIKPALSATSDKESFPELVTKLSESSVQRTCERNVGLERISVDESMHRHGEVSVARKEIFQTAATISPSSVCEKGYLREEKFEKSLVDTTILQKISEGNVMENCNNTTKQDPNHAISKERNLGDLVARSSKNYDAKEVCNDQGGLGNQEIISTVSNLHVSNNILPNSVGVCALKGTTDAVFEKLLISSKLGTFFDAGVDSFKILKDYTTAASNSNDNVMLAENILNATILSQKKSMQVRGTIVGGSEKGNACELKNSQQNLSSPGQKLLKSPLAPRSWHELADMFFFSSVEDVGLEVEVGPNDISSFVSEDSPMKQISSQLIPLQFIQNTAAVAARGSSITRKRRRGCSRRRGGWRKIKMIKETNEEADGEMLFKKGNYSQSNTRSRYACNGRRSRIITRKTLYNKERADRITRMGIQRYHLRKKSIEGCAPVMEESHDPGVKLSQSRLLGENLEAKREFRKRGRKRGTKRALESTLVTEEVLPQQKHAEAVMHSKDTGDENPVSISDETAHSKCVKNQISTVTSLGILTNEDADNVSGMRGCNLPSQKKSFCETRSYNVAKDAYRYFIRRRKKLKLSLVQENMDGSKTCEVTTSRGTSESPVFSSEFIKTQIGYNLRNRVLQLVNAKTLPASVPECSEEDAEKKRPNAPCPAIPVYPLQPIKKGRPKRKQSYAVSENDAVREKTIDGEVAEDPQKPSKKRRYNRKLKCTFKERNTRVLAKESGMNGRDSVESPEAQIPLIASEKTKPNENLSSTGLQPANINASPHLNSQTVDKVINAQPKIQEAPVTARTLDENLEVTSCPVLNFLAGDDVSLHERRTRELAEREEVIISESAVSKQVGDGNECGRTQNLDQITTSNETADETFHSLGPLSSCTPSSSLDNELVEMKSPRKSKILRYPVTVQNNSGDTSLWDLSSAKKEELPTVQGRHKNKNGLGPVSVKLSHDNKEDLELMKTLKPFSINLGLRCDSKEFLSQLCATYGEDFVAAAFKLKQEKESRTSLSRAENGKGSRRTTSGHLSLDGHESKRRTKLNKLRRSISQNLLVEEMPALTPECSVKQEMCGFKISNDNVKNTSQGPRVEISGSQNLLVEKIPALTPEFSVKQEEICGLKMSNNNVKKASQGPRVEKMVIDVGEEDRRKPILVSSRQIDDNEVQIVLELVNLHQMQTCINRSKGRRKAESTKEGFVAQSLSSSTPSSHNDSNHARRRNEKVFEKMTLKSCAEEKLFSTPSIMTSGMQNMMVDKEQELEENLNKAAALGGKQEFYQSSPCTALSNIVVTNVRSGAELTEEERDIPLVLECDELSEIRGQASCNELREIPLEEDTEIEITHVGCKKDDSNCLFRRNAVCEENKCMIGGELRDSLQENVIHRAGYSNWDHCLPDVVKVSHANFSCGDTMLKESESNLKNYLNINGAFSKDSLLPRLHRYGVDIVQYDHCNDESVQIEKFIPLITLSPQKELRANAAQTTKVPESPILQNNQSKPAIHNNNEIIKHQVKDCKSQEIEDMYPSEVNLVPNHLPCNDSMDSILHRKTIPNILNPQKISGTVVNQDAYHSSSFRPPFKENNWDVIPQNITSTSKETTNNLFQCSLEVHLPATATVPPYILSKLKAIDGFVPGDAEGMRVQSFDHFPKLQKLEHNTCTQAQEVSITGTVSPGTSGCSGNLVEHQIIKLGEIWSNNEDRLRKEFNTFAKSLGMKLLITPPLGNQLGKFTLCKEKKPERDIIRVDYCKSNKMKQIS